MKKLILQFAGLVMAFFIVWSSFGMMPWKKWLQIDNFNKKKQVQINKWVLHSYSIDKEQLHSDTLLMNINGIKNRICLANKIDTGSIKLHIFKDGEINAFSVPYKQILVNTALIAACDNQEMLAGVLAHEIAHIELSHISKRMAKEMAISTVVMMTGDNFGFIKQILQNATSKHFDRGQEEDADIAAVAYLQNAGINPLPLADFFDKLSRREGKNPQALKWLSTHPDSKQRAAEIRRIAKKTSYSNMPDSNWQLIRNRVKAGY